MASRREYEGATVIAQDEKASEFSGTPMAVALTVDVGAVLPVAEIAPAPLA